MCAKILFFNFSFKLNHFQLRLDDSMANVFVYGVATAADVSADRRTRSPNMVLLFFRHKLHSFTLTITLQ